MPHRDYPALFAGLMVAWGGPAFLISPAANRLFGPPESLSAQLLGQLAMWALLALVFAIALLWEKQPLSSLGLRRFSWCAIGWGLALAAAMIYAIVPVLSWALRSSGIAGFEAGMAKVLALPIWIRLIAAITAGIVEDGLFLGYAFTRLEQLVGVWAGGVISVAASALLHLSNWGWGPVAAYLVTGAIATAFFAWRRDLLANMVAHVTVDTMGLVVVPVFLNPTP